MAALEKFFLYRYIIAASVIDKENFTQWMATQDPINQSLLQDFTKGFREILKESTDEYINIIKGNGTTISKLSNDLFMGRLTGLRTFLKTKLQLETWLDQQLDKLAGVNSLYQQDHPYDKSFDTAAKENYDNVVAINQTSNFFPSQLPTNSNAELSNNMKKAQPSASLPLEDKPNLQLTNKTSFPYTSLRLLDFTQQLNNIRVFAKSRAPSYHDAIKNILKFLTDEINTLAHSNGTRNQQKLLEQLKKLIEECPKNKLKDGDLDIDEYEILGETLFKEIALIKKTFPRFNGSLSKIAMDLETLEQIQPRKKMKPSSQSL